MDDHKIGYWGLQDDEKFDNSKGYDADADVEYEDEVEWNNKYTDEVDWWYDRIDEIEPKYKDEVVDDIEYGIDANPEPHHNINYLDTFFPLDDIQNFINDNDTMIKTAAIGLGLLGTAAFGTTAIVSEAINPKNRKKHG